MSDDTEELSRRFTQLSVGGGHQVFPVNVPQPPCFVQWKIHPSHVFKSEEEKDMIQQSSDQENVRTSVFWLHPVRFEPAIDEPNVRRTIQIDHLPLECTEKDILSTLRYGKVESIVLVRFGHLNTKDARIVFTRERSASLFARYANQQHLTIHGKPVRVYHQEEPTYPHNPEVDTAVYILQMSRIISTLGQLGMIRIGGDLLDVKVDGDKTTMEFRSILQAYKAKLTLEAYGFQISREPDYCNTLTQESSLDLQN